MKRLTVNRLAAASLRGGGRARFGLALSLGLAVFLIAGLCLCAQGLMLAQREKTRARLGSQDVILFDSPCAGAQLKQLGWFDQIGNVYVTARVEDGAAYMGYYDETAAALLSRRLIKGRMPQSPGEIAVEESTLALIAGDGWAGDGGMGDGWPGGMIRLKVAGLDGAEETREYALCGILDDQSQLLSPQGIYFSDILLNFPSVLTCAEEPRPTSGRGAVHRVMTLAAGYSLRQALDGAAQSPLGRAGGLLMGVSEDGELVLSASMLGALRGPAAWSVLRLAYLAGALLLAACTGICGAMESQLAARREQIAMLRAVGATRRQIRRIFGRETWLMSLMVAPASVGLCCACVYALSRAFPGELAFQPRAWLLLPVWALSAAVIALSSGLPLRRAARVMPVQALDEAAAPRKIRRVRSRARFRVAALVCRRQIYMSSGRLAAPALIIALSMVVASFASVMALDSLDNAYAGKSEFELYASEGDITVPRFAGVAPARALSGNDLNQMRALSQVKSVEAQRAGLVNLLIERVPGYFAPDDYAVDTMYLDEQSMHVSALEHDAARAALGTQRLLVPVALVIMDAQSDAWQNCLSQLKARGEIAGEVDWDALDAGDEIIAFAPNYYFQIDGDGGLTVSTSRANIMRVDDTRENDFFTPGQKLDFAQLTFAQSGADWPQDAQTYAQYRDAYARCEARNFTATVGAVITGDMSSIELYDFWAPALIATEQGAKRLGVNADAISRVGVSLYQVPDEYDETTLEKQLSRIARRGGMELYNNLKAAREHARDARGMAALFGAMAVVFLSVSVALIAGNLSRRIRLDERQIGALRAVGADMRMLRACYGGQVWLCVGLGYLLGAGLLCALALCGMLPFGVYGAKISGVILGLNTLFALSAALCCLWTVRLRVGRIAQKSIVDNIKEL